MEWLAECLLPLSVKDDIEYMLSQDPRPAYHHDSQREYKLDYAGYKVTFCVKEEELSSTVQVKKIEKL